jgi:hypothetical protein
VGVQHPKTHSDVHALGDEVSNTVADEQIDVQVRISVLELAQLRSQQVMAERSVGVDAQPSSNVLIKTTATCGEAF